MLLSDLPFVDDVKKGESYLEREIFCVVTPCYVFLFLLCWTSLLCYVFLFLCCGHGYGCVLCIYIMLRLTFLHL